MGDEKSLGDQLKEQLEVELNESRAAYEAQKERGEAARAKLDKVEEELEATKSKLDTEKPELEKAKGEQRAAYRGMYEAAGHSAGSTQNFDELFDNLGDALTASQERQRERQEEAAKHFEGIENTWDGKSPMPAPRYYGPPSKGKSPTEKAMEAFSQSPHIQALDSRVGALGESVRSLTAAATELESTRTEIQSEVRDAEVQEGETKAIYEETQSEYDKTVKKAFAENLWQAQDEAFDPSPATSRAVLDRFDPDASDHAVLDRYDPDKPRRVTRTRRVATIAVGATIAIGATVVGASLLGSGDGSPNSEAPAVVAPAADQSETGQSGSSDAPSDPGAVEDDGSNDSVGDAGASSVGAVDLVEIGRVALKGTGRTVPDGQAFDTFFHMLFVPNDAIATVNRLYDEEDYLDSAGEELAAATGGEVIAEVEVTQFSADPATGAPGQNTFGVVVQVDPTTFMMAAFGTDGSTFSEANAFVLICDVPGCVGTDFRGANVGGPFGLDLRQAIRDAISILQEGPTQISDDYGWVIEMDGSITASDSPQSGVASETFPIDSGTFEGSHWVKWQLDEPVADQVEFHTTYSLNISSNEDGLWIAGLTFPLNGEAFATGGCLEDRPDCDTGEVLVEGELNTERDEIIFRFAEGIFGNATGLEIFAFEQTYVDPNAAPETEAAADGARIPLGTDERDPC